MIERGRRLVLFDIGLVLGVSLVVIAFFVRNVGSGKLSEQVIRLLVTAVLCLLLFRGYSLARYALIVLLSLAFGLSVVVVPRLLKADESLGAVAVACMAAIYGYVAANLAGSAAIREFLESQRQKRIGRPGNGSAR